MYIPRIGIVDHLVNSTVLFEELPNCFPQWLYQFIFSSTVYEGSPFFICQEVVHFGAESVNTSYSRKLFIEFIHETRKRDIKENIPEGAFRKGLIISILSMKTRGTFSDLS